MTVPLQEHFKMPGYELQVCVIGAGPSGLCSLRHILSSRPNIQGVIFEQQGDIGGVWNYTNGEVKLWDSKGNPMVFPMYTDLRCNLPKQLMEFKDFKHKADVGTFATQQEIHQYLVEYSNHFGLLPCIKLNSRVVSVKYLETGQWLVTVEDTKSFELNSYIFDAIMCCVGVNFYPHIPKMEGMNTFQGRILHSKFFKTCSDFRDKQVVCLGLGPSCADLCLKLANVAKQVVACHRFPGGFSLGELPPNVRETASITKLNEWSVRTENGEEIPCEVLILCTGYEPIFPFLGSDLGVDYKEGDSIVNHLYKKMLMLKYPSFCFINAHGMAAEFLVMEVQAKYFVSCLEGKVFVPPLPIMARSVTRDIKRHGKRRRRKLTESLRGERFALTEIRDYLEDLVTEADCAPDFKHIPLHLAVFQWVIGRIFGSLAVYRRDQLRVITPAFWEYTSAPTKEGEEVAEGSSVRTFHLEKDGTVEVKDVKN